MLRHLAKRLLLTLPTFVALMFVTFLMIRLVPGDPVEARRGERGISPERHAQLLHDMGLDQPVWQQFGRYVWGILHGDFGTSIISHSPVIEEFLKLFPATLELTMAAMLFATLIGVPAGVIAAVRRGKFSDQALMGMALTGYSMPLFWWGLILILIMSNTAPPDAGVGPRGPDQVLLSAGHRLCPGGFTAVGTEGRVHRCPAPSGTADDRSGHRAAGSDRAHDALVHA